MCLAPASAQGMAATSMATVRRLRGVCAKATFSSALTPAPNSSTPQGHSYVSGRPGPGPHAAPSRLLPPPPSSVQADLAPWLRPRRG